MRKENYAKTRIVWRPLSVSAILGAAGLAVSGTAAAAGCGGNNNPCPRAPAARPAPPAARPAAPPAVIHTQAAGPPATSARGMPGARPAAAQVMPNPHAVTQRAATMPVLPPGGLHRPLPHFAAAGAPGRPSAPVVFEFYRPAAPFTRGVSFGPMPVRVGGSVFIGVASAAPVNPDPMVLVQYNSVAVASGDDVRQAYVADVGSAPSQVQLVGFAVGSSRPVIDRSTNDFMMIKGTGALVVPAGSQAVANEHLLLYPPGADAPLEKNKPLSLAPDGGQFEDQFSIPLSTDSPQGDYKYTVQVVVNEQVMAEESGAFQAL